MKDVKNVIQWIKQYFSQNGPLSKAIIGISGGKDSTVAAALCVKALGRDRVIGILMPEGEQEDIEDAYRVCDYLDIKYYEINIDAACSGIYRGLASEGLHVGMPAVYTNVPARVRMTTLYAVAASVGGRVCNTSNLSEIFVGYSTKWGDGVGDFGPLRAFTMEEVIDLGRQLALPEDLLVKPPADGMSGKTDEDNLGFKYSDVSNVIWGNTELVDKKVLDTIISRYINAKHKDIKIPCCPR